MKTHFKSLRTYIDALAEIGEVQPIDKEVDWNLEIGAIAYLSAVPLAVLILKHCKTVFYRIDKLTASPDKLTSIDVKHQCKTNKEEAKDVKGFNGRDQSRSL